MLRGLYTAATGMYVAGRRMDVTANNVVNADTNGYKRETLAHRSFQDYLIEGFNHPAETAQRTVGPLGLGVHIDDMKIAYEQGSLEETGRYADFALEGRGFFVVETPEGERYTREGNFWVNESGYLLTAEGYYVLGREGERLNVGNDDTIAVGREGSISIDAEYIGGLRIVDFEDPQLLRKEGDNLFIKPDDVEPQDAACVVLQGFLENSNVDMGREMVRLIEVQRSYELNQRIVRMYDESLGRTVNDIARV